MRIVGICGSLQATSSNLTLLRAVAERMPRDVEYEIFDGIRDLPLFDPDLVVDGRSPTAVERWRGVVAVADALIVASPEYGHSLPGSLKNAIDWLIGSGELEGKLVGVTASVAHESRGRRGLEALLGTLAAVSAQVVGGAPIARDASEVERLTSFVGALVAAAAEGGEGTVPA